MWIRTHDNELIDTGGALIKAQGSKLIIITQGSIFDLASYKDAEAAKQALDKFQAEFVNHPDLYLFKNDL